MKASMTVRVAAEQFGIPKRTLHRKLKGELVYCKMSPWTVLTEAEEQELVDIILYSAEHGFPVTKRQLLDTVQKHLNNNDRKRKFPNNRPPKKWFRAFWDRHPNISFCKVQKFSTKRALITEEELWNKIKIYFYITVLTLASASGEMCNSLILYCLKNAPRKSTAMVGWLQKAFTNTWQMFFING